MPRKVTILAAAFIGLHLLEAFTVGTSPLGSILAESLESLAAAFGAAMCFSASRRAQGMSRLFWLLFGLGIASQCVTDLAYAYYEARLRGVPSSIPVVPALLVVRAALFALALLLDPEKDSSRLDSETVIDFVQVTIIFAFVYLYLNFIPMHYSPSLVDLKRPLLVVLGERCGLVLLAIFRMLYSERQHLQRLYRGFLLYLSWYLFAEGAAIYFVETRGIRSGTLVDLVWTLPTLAVAVLAAGWTSDTQAVQAASNRPKTLSRLLLSDATFVSAPMVVFLQVIYLGPELPLLRYSLLGVSILCFALRLGLADYRQSQHLDSLRLNELALEASKKALTLQKAFLEQLIENAPDAIAIVGRDNLIVRINRRFTELFGYTSEEAVRQRLSILIVPTDKRAESALLEQEARQGKVAGRETIRLNKQRIPIDVSVLVAEVELGLAEGAVYCTYRDVRERRQIEARLRESEKMEAVGQLAGGVAHDFNNLLGVIIGYSQVLSTTLANDPKSLRRLEAIKKAGQRAVSLTRQLLAFGRRQMLSPVVLSLNDIAAETEKMLKPLIGEDIELKVTLDPALGKVTADSGQIVQILLNLAINARDAMPDGGVLTISTANVEVGKRKAFRGVAVRPGSYVVLKLSDTGIGIPAETLPRIFEPFFTTKPVGQGTGLGLATVYGIVKQSNGYIFVESESQKGTRFEIYLPQVEEPETTLTTKELQAQIQAQMPTACETVLLVEDETAFCELVSESLRESGYQLLVAPNGKMAIDLARKHEGPIHVLLTDMIMPLMSGPELARLMSATRPETKVLYMSGYSGNNLGPFKTLDPSAAIIQKPFELSTLAEKLQDVLREGTASIPHEARE
jgi:two-component system, cell cycle sensor histidine kinase and response regulator CckA